MRMLSDRLAVGAPAVADGWQSLTECRVLIFVGLTGVGKTTTQNELSALGLAFTLLPNRRTLTDDLLIAELQLADGEPVATVQDRAQRFAYTRRYRERYAGGMAYALTQLAVKQVGGAPDPLYFFDGLRGVNEVSHAAKRMPHARFIVLMASDFVRVQRLIKRNDQFDQIGSSAQSRDPLEQNVLGDAAALFTESEQDQLYRLVDSGEVAREELQAKLKIIAAERRNYDPDASCEALQTLAPDRTLLVDTNLFAPPEVARQIADFV